MDTTQIMAFTLVASLLVISPGPNGLLIAKTTPLSGKRAGFANIAGFLTAFYLHGALSLFGISVILTQSAEAFLAVKVLGAIYLVWIGLKALINAFTSHKSQMPPPASQASNHKKTLIKAYLEGFLTNTLNPKVSLFYLAAFPQFIPAGDNALWYGMLLVSIHALINTLWFSTMVLLLARLSTFTKEHIMQKLLNGITGIIFIGFGAKLMTLHTD